MELDESHHRLRLSFDIFLDQRVQLIFGLVLNLLELIGIVPLVQLLPFHVFFLHFEVLSNRKQRRHLPSAVHANIDIHNQILIRVLLPILRI